MKAQFTNIKRSGYERDFYEKFLLTSSHNSLEKSAKKICQNFQLFTRWHHKFHHKNDSNSHIPLIVKNLHSTHIVKFNDTHSISIKKTFFHHNNLAIFFRKIIPWNFTLLISKVKPRKSVINFYFHSTVNKKRAQQVVIRRKENSEIFPQKLLEPPRLIIDLDNSSVLSQLERNFKIISWAIA